MVCARADRWDQHPDLVQQPRPSKAQDAYQHPGLFCLYALKTMTEMLPLFLNLSGRTVVLVGGGPVAAVKLRQLRAANANVRVVAPSIVEEIARAEGALVSIARRGFVPADLDD